MEIHRELGMGFKKNVHKDALEIGFRNNSIPYCREKTHPFLIPVIR